jgi:hypothetical protein
MEKIMKELNPILFDIKALGGKGVRIPEKEEYPDLFPKDGRGFCPVDEHYKAHLSHAPKNEIEELENQGFITTTMVNGSKIVDLV